MIFQYICIVGHSLQCLIPHILRLFFGSLKKKKNVCNLEPSTEVVIVLVEAATVIIASPK